ncbi:hypothetical protein HCN44_004195 [Aphidius gifuensis]|uniref:Amino acid transporter n=1 Tax=Aphidius gifuensis TaxID=684658 RepID=A0A834XWD3_APHGI|nr:hypothetical protein HCN44_004195 [Aphidius gifuensis]
MALPKLTSENRSSLFNLIGITSGIIIGFYLKYFYKNKSWNNRELMQLQFIGELFLRSVNCLILPLIISSIVCASCRVCKSKNIGLMAFYYYTTTTVLGITLCVVLAQTIQPGKFYQNDELLKIKYNKKFITTDILLDLLRYIICLNNFIYLENNLIVFFKNYLRNLVPDNLIEACISQYQTILIEPENSNKDIYQWNISHRYGAGTNVLGVVSFSLLLGISIGKMKEKGKPLEELFQSLSDIVTEIMSWLMTLIPIGVLFLIPGKLLETQDIGIMLSRLGIYVLTVLLGLFIQGFIILPFVYFICTNKSPIEIFKNIGPAIITAIGTSSSTATIPMTLKCLDKIGVNKKVSRFVVPLGATINMDGIALYETIGAIFIIQLRGFDYSLMGIISIAIMCTVSCIGAAGLPSGGHVMLIVVLESIGIPPEDVTLIITIDCFVDRLRTAVNIIADALGASLISHYCHDEISTIELNEFQQLQMPFVE